MFAEDKDEEDPGSEEEQAFGAQEHVHGKHDVGADVAKKVGLHRFVCFCIRPFNLSICVAGY